MILERKRSLTLSELTITRGPDAGTSFHLGDSQIVGRLKKNPIALNDAGASREHARIFKKGGQFWIVDLNSSNGVFVNGERVDRSELADDDEIRIGETWMRIALDPTDQKEAVGAPAARSSTQVFSDDEVVLRDQRGATVSDRMVGSPRKAAVSRGPLGFLRHDMSQASGLTQTLIWGGVVLLCAALAYLAYSVAA